MSGDWEKQDDNCCLPPPPQREPLLGDPNEAQHRGGYGRVDIDAVIARAKKYHGNGLTPKEVLALVNRCEMFTEWQESMSSWQGELRGVLGITEEESTLETVRFLKHRMDGLEK